MKYDGERLRDEIARRQLSITAFAKTAGVSNYAVYRAIAGKGARTETLGKIAAALNIKNPSDLLQPPAQM